MKKIVKSDISEVTLYRTGVCIIRKAVVELDQGRVRLLWRNLSKSLIKETIRSQMPKGIRCVKQECTLYIISETNEKGKEQGELEECKKEKLQIEDRIHEVEEERNFIKNFIDHIQTEVSSFDDVRKYMEYINDKIKVLNKEKRELDLKREEIEDKIKILETAIADRKDLKEEKYNEIALDIDVSEKGTYEIYLTYCDKRASWNPFYDIIVEDINNPVTIGLKGKISQNTGEDWNGVRMKISTGAVEQYNNQPSLKPWYLSKYEPGKRLVEPPLPLTKYAPGNETTLLSAPGAPPFQTQVYDKNIILEYMLSDRYDLLNGEQDSVISIFDETFQADYLYHTVPKAEEKAFLRAAIKNYGEVKLIEGDANVFFKNSRVGAIHITPDRWMEGAGIELGRDESVIVKRKKIKDTVTESKITSTKKVIREYEIFCWNQKSSDIKIIIRDQLPVSRDSAITVEPINLSGAVFDNIDGTLSWEYTMHPNTSVKLNIAFSVSYPKNIRIENL